MPRTIRTVTAAAATLVAALALAATTAPAAQSVRFGVYDDAWLTFGPGTLAERVATLTRLGVQIARVDLRWDAIAARKPARPDDPLDPAYDWSQTDPVLEALRARGIEPLVTIYGTPAWANGGRGPNWAPGSADAMASFARAAATRYPWVTHWLVWNEPNQARWLRPTLPGVYVSRLLDPAYDAIHATIPGALVGGGVTAPRSGSNGVSPARWIAGMAAAGARLDAYAHHPYPSRPSETPFSGGCSYCADITMATLGRLLTDVRKAFGQVPIWLTEYGYQTNPPNWILGVSPQEQARYIGEAALRAYQAPQVTMLIQFLVQDEPAPDPWQSGLYTASGAAKPAAAAFRLPLAEVDRRGLVTRLWGQVRVGQARRPYRLERLTAVGWRWVGAAASTNVSGFWETTIRARPGARIRVWSPTTHELSPPLTVT